jgi:hypothetical protein
MVCTIGRVRICGLIISVSLCGAMALAVFKLPCASGDIMSRSLHVADLPYCDGLDIPGLDQWWISDHQIAYLDHRLGHRGFVVRDLRRGTTVALSPLTRRFLASNGADGATFPSPDGHKIVWHCGTYKGMLTYAVSSVDSGDMRFWTSADTELKWRSDSAGWITYTPNGPSGTILSVTTYEYASLATKRISMRQASAPFNTIALDGAIVASDGRLVLETSWNGAVQAMPNITVESLCLQGDRHRLVKAVIPMSANIAVNQVTVSPCGKYVVWQITYPRQTIIDRVYRRLHIPRRSPPQYVTSFYLARTDGTCVHELGRMSITLQQNDGSMYWPDVIAWLPGSAGFLYTYRNSVYCYRMRREEM